MHPDDRVVSAILRSMDVGMVRDRRVSAALSDSMIDPTIEDTVADIDDDIDNLVDLLGPMPWLDNPWWDRHSTLYALDIDHDAAVTELGVWIEQCGDDRALFVRDGVRSGDFLGITSSYFFIQEIDEGDGLGPFMVADNVSHQIEGAMVNPFTQSPEYWILKVSMGFAAEDIEAVGTAVWTMLADEELINDSR